MNLNSFLVSVGVILALGAVVLLILGLYALYSGLRYTPDTPTPERQTYRYKHSLVLTAISVLLFAVFFGLVAISTFIHNTLTQVEVIIVAFAFLGFTLFFSYKAYSTRHQPKD